MNNKKVFDFIGYRKVLFLIPIVIAVITVIFNCIFGIEMAIEFKGGTMLTYSYTGEIDTNAVKKTVEGENYGAVTVTTGSSMNSSLEVIEISFSSSEGLTADKQTALSDKLQQTFKDNSLTLVNSQDVNPTSGTEFFLKCLVAVLFSFILLVIYIAFRFKKIGGLSAGVFALVALVHDCFMALWDRQAPLDPEEARMLLFAMTRNRCLNYLKHKSIVDKYTISCLARAKIGEERLYNYDFSFAENGHPYLYQELEQQIQRIMDSLPERCREVFFLSRFQGLKNREIAERLHISLHTVERHIQRALRIFAEALEREQSIYLQILILAWLMNQPS